MNEATTLTGNVLIEGVKDSDYRAMEGLNASSLSEGMRSMRHLRHCLDNPDSSSSDSLELGTLVHLLALQPELFDSRYIVVPKVDRRTKEGKAAWETFTATAGNREIITESVLEQAQAIVAALKAHKLAGPLLAAKGPCEVVARWNDPRTGAACKGRLDKFIPGVLALDLKTTRDASPSGFAESYYRYGYHRQIAWYSEGFQLCSGKPTPFVIVAVETEAPHGITVLQPDIASINYGRWDNRKVLDKYAACLKTGNWPSYDEEVRTVCVPRWAADRYETQMAGELE